MLDAAEAALPGGRCCVLTSAGERVRLAEARARPLEVAAANWVASALAVAARASGRARWSTSGARPPT